MKNVKIEWCENFIKSVFKKYVQKNGGIEINCFGTWRSVPVFGNVERMALRCHQLSKN